MDKRRGSVIDRRSGKDRRRGIGNLEYYWNGGGERRSLKDRRVGRERRSDWVQAGK